MDIEKIISSLERFGTTLPAILMHVSEEDARWKPDSGDWSILEIACHLVDEETEDFRKRVQLTLEDPTQEWPPIDPEAIAVERKYNEQKLMETAAKFYSAREESVKWLKDLENPDWDVAYDHPKIGPVPIGNVLVSWAAHDHLHLRQISKRLYQITNRDAAPYSTDYAGKW